MVSAVHPFPCKKMKHLKVLAQVLETAGAFRLCWSPGGPRALVKYLRCFVNTHSVVAKLVSAQSAPSHRKCLLFLIHRGPVIKRDPNKLRMKMNFKAGDWTLKSYVYQIFLQK